MKFSAAGNLNSVNMVHTHRPGTSGGLGWRQAHHSFPTGQVRTCAEWDRSRFSAALVSSGREYSCIERQRWRERCAFSCGPVRHVASGDAFRRFCNRCCCPPLRLGSHRLSDFISSPHSPFKSLIRLLLRHIVVGQLTYITPCRHLKPVAPGAHLAHSTEQRTTAWKTQSALLREGDDLSLVPRHSHQIGDDYNV